MKFRLAFTLSLLAVLAAAASTLAAAALVPMPATVVGPGPQLSAPVGRIRVFVEGEVAHPGWQQVPAGTRLVPVLERATPLPAAYLPGAALLRVAARRDQIRLKAGLDYDLRQWQQGSNAALAAAARALRAQLQPLPITGRIPEQSLEPRWLEVRAALNRPLAAGDRIVYPPRPQDVRVVGAVAQPCTLAQVPLRAARRYLAQCPRLAAADKDLLYVIQPDGNVSVHGIALWNRDAGQSLAPGAVLYVPLAANTVQALDPDFNREYAQLLATQVIGGTGEPRAESGRPGRPGPAASAPTAAAATATPVPAAATTSAPLPAAPAVPPAPAPAAAAPAAPVAPSAPAPAARAIIPTPIPAAAAAPLAPALAATTSASVSAAPAATYAPVPAASVPAASVPAASVPAASVPAAATTSTPLPAAPATTSAPAPAVPATTPVPAAAAAPSASRATP